MMPGQTPYTPEEAKRLEALVRDAADGDPGEQDEPRPTPPAERPKCEYLTCAQTAKLVRAALKKAFPSVRFSVRSSTYSGGASIDVRWTDGPTRAEVEAVAKQYEGGGFDGSIDMAYNVDSWLMPDGSARVAYSPGTMGSRGYAPKISEPKPDPAARFVSFGADYIFCTRMGPEDRPEAPVGFRVMDLPAPDPAPPATVDPARKWADSQIWSAAKRAGYDSPTRDDIVRHYREGGADTLPEAVRDIVSDWPAAPQEVA